MHKIIELLNAIEMPHEQRFGELDSRSDRDEI